MTKLSQTQTEILTSAAGTAGGATEAPDGAKGSIAGLIRRGLLISMPQANGPSQLLITDAGRAALAVDDSGVQGQVDAVIAEKPSAGSKRKRPAPASDITLPKPHGKIATLVDLLRKPDGASIEAMMAATGWQAHSVRGAISGSIKKGLGLTVISEKTDAGRRYRIAPEVGA